MRIVKDAAERRNEILDAAELLFAEKGFDGTSTNDILNKVGIARGTLYYHFKSKEHIMDALINRYNVNILQVAKRIASDRSVPVIERIIRVVMALNIKQDVNSKGIIEHIHKPQNALMHQKIQKLMIVSVPPILAEIVREGNDKGLFNTPYPYECMELAVIYASTVFDDDIVELNQQERNSRIYAFIGNLERLLGAESGSLMSIMVMFDNSHDDRNEEE